MEDNGFGKYSDFIKSTEKREKIESDIETLEAKKGSLLGEVRSRELSGTYGDKEVSGDYDFWWDLLYQNIVNKNEAEKQREALLDEKIYMNPELGKLSIREVEERWARYGAGDKEKLGVNTFEEYLEKYFTSRGKTGDVAYKEQQAELATIDASIQTYSNQQRQALDVLGEYEDIYREEYAALEREIANLKEVLREVVKAINE
ncbi:MAG: hypothetical protein WDA09_09145 [Bacteriovoracaceae bacterium]